MKLVETLHSKEDASVNFIFQGNNPEFGYLEARYVRRRDDYFVCYLSSQTGCSRGCKFCHLTATKQTVAVDATVDQILEQARAVLRYAFSQPIPAKVVHFSFMARGEALMSRTIHGHSPELLWKLGDEAQEYHFLPRFMVSTIMPRAIQDTDLRDIFPVIHPSIYYSIYSMDQAFRDKWLPLAMDPYLALDKLKDYQDHTGKVIKLHWAFIEGENASTEHVVEIARAVNERKLRVDVNIVRYNPFSEHLGREPEELVVKLLAETLRNVLPRETNVKVVSRVGPDVYASCGMFKEKA